MSQHKPIKVLQYNVWTWRKVCYVCQILQDKIMVLPFLWPIQTQLPWGQTWMPPHTPSLPACQLLSVYDWSGELSPQYGHDPVIENKQIWIYILLYYLHIYLSSMLCSKRGAFHYCALGNIGFITDSGMQGVSIVTRLERTDLKEKSLFTTYKPTTRFAIIFANECAFVKWL